MEPSKLVMVASIDVAAKNAPAIHLISLVNALQHQGFAIVLLIPKFSGAPPVPLDDKTLTIVRTRRLLMPGIPSALNALAQLPAVWRYRHHGTIYIRVAPMSFTTSIAAWAFGYGRRILEVNGWFADELASLGYARAISWAAERVQVLEAKLATHIRVVTPNLKTLLQSFKVDTTRIVAIGNGTDLAIFKPLAKSLCREQLGLAAKKHYIAFSGNIAPWQDLETAFKALAMLRGRGKALELLVAGGGQNLDKVKSQAQDICGPDAVHFLGPLTPADVNVVLNAADIAIAPFTFARNTRIGLSPLKIRDYAAAGKAVVTNDLPGLTDLGEEEWVELVPCEDEAALAAAIEGMLNRTGDELDALRRRARTYAEQEFDWRAVSTKLSEFIRPDQPPPTAGK